MLRLKLAGILCCAVATASAASAQEDNGFSSTSNDRDGSATVTVTAEDGEHRGASAVGAGSGPGCWRDDGRQVPCSTDLGWWSAEYDCYLQLVDSAPSDDPGRAGEGQFRCDPGPLGWGAGQTQVFLWLPLTAAGPDPAVLAQQAIDSMQLRGIDIGTAPPMGAPVLVNAPVWLWADAPGPATWGPISTTAAAGGVSVTATAAAEHVSWEMGDGTTVTCTTGTAYARGMDPAAAPCGHTYRGPGSREVTATTSWQVEWIASTGQTGAETVSTSSTTTIEVREARAFITGRG